MPQPLLVPLDGSDFAEAAIPWAARLSQAHRLPLVLVRAVRSARHGTADTTDQVQEQRLSDEAQAATVYLADIQNRLTTQGESVQTMIRSGTPGEVILDVADETGAFAIVMATHGRGGLGRLVLGSVAQEVLQRATTPILLVRGHGASPDGTPSLGRLLIPLDGSPLAEMALDYALSVAESGATLVLTRVVAPVNTAVMVGVSAIIKIDEEATRAALAEAEAYVNGLTEKIRQAGFAAEALVCRGRPAEQALASARAARADLIVMTTHGRTGTRRWRLGSVADEVARHADRPVFLISARTLSAAAVGQLSVRDVMTREVTALRPDESVTVALRKLLRNRISGAPVVDDAGDLVGMMSGHDLLAWQAAVVDLDTEPGRVPDAYDRRMEADTVAQVMSAVVVAIDESTPLSTALRLFLERRLRRVPVTRDGRLVGILSRVDLLKAMAQQWKVTTLPEDSARD